jgi:glycerol-3-phosphate dehydrogenase (NAD(P)+)
MKRVAILGSGVMGSALAFPLADNGYAVALCGTAFDRPIIARLRQDRWHPGLKREMPASVEPYAIEEVDRALAGASILILGVVSEAVGAMARLAAAHLAAGACIVNVAKGVEAEPDGKLRTLPELVSDALPGPRRSDTAVVAVAGPCKALELAARRPTRVVFAAAGPAALARCGQAFATDYYRVELSEDIRGVEICAAAKNGYAIGLGVCDGIDAGGEGSWDNLRAAVFTQAVAEMAGLARLFEGRAESAYGLAGLGDLFVTYRQGRNQTLGRLLGQGMAAGQALAEMRGATVEGVEAVRKIHIGLQGALSNPQLARDFPLLDAIHAVLFRGAPAGAISRSLAGAV